MRMDLFPYTIAGRRFGHMENKSMLKVASSSVVFAEIPDEICLALEISGCPCHCEGCSSPWLADDVGAEVDAEWIADELSKHPDVSAVLFMGGDAFPEDVAAMCDAVHGLGYKTAMYSGRDFLDVELMRHLDYVKIGRFILPKGDAGQWHLTNNGPICFPWSNQLLFRRSVRDGRIVWENITHLFREHPVHDVRRRIVSPASGERAQASSDIE